MAGKILPWAAIALVLSSIALPLSAVSPRNSRPSVAAIVLYDGALNTGTPETQGFLYLTNPPGSVQATQMFTTPVTTLDTMPQMSDYAGYFARPTLYPKLDRASGYQVIFTVQIMSETHISPDRAGFSLLVESNDKRGIELGFWGDEIWAQEGGTLQPFTHAEGTTFTTTTDLVAYRLSVLGNSYALAVNGSTVLSGPLRDYAVSPPPPQPLNPYNTPNLIFLGDDTSAAQARIKFRYAAVINAPPFAVYLPLVSNDQTQSGKFRSISRSCELSLTSYPARCAGDALGVRAAKPRWGLGTARRESSDLVNICLQSAA
jgi:hypothetical protein